MSIDTMDSRTPGFVAQLKGLLTKRRYKHATMFKDRYSDLMHAHLHQSNNGESFVEAKTDFEAYAQKHNVNVKHYHADDKRFVDNAFVAHVESKNQTIHYCASCAHHQNRRAEKL